MPLPAVPFDCSELVTVQTDSMAKFTLHRGKHTYSTAPMYANTSLFTKLTAYKVIVLDKNYREITRHARLYGDKHLEAIGWIPYLTQLSRRPAALKSSGIYALFPEEVKAFLESLNIPGKRGVLATLVKLSQQAGFNSAINALKTAAAHGAKEQTASLLPLPV